jgi:single-stranded DNA-binding protein
MTANLSKITLIGRLGKDPELFQAAGGKSRTTFPLVVGGYTGRGDERKESTTWFRITVWGRAAENARVYPKAAGSTLTGGSRSKSRLTARVARALLWPSPPVGFSF